MRRRSSEEVEAPTRTRSSAGGEAARPSGCPGPHCAAHRRSPRCARPPPSSSRRGGTARSSNRRSPRRPRPPAAQKEYLAPCDHLSARYVNPNSPFSKAAIHVGRGAGATTSSGCRLRFSRRPATFANPGWDMSFSAMTTSAFGITSTKLRYKELAPSLCFFLKRYLRVCCFSASQ